MRKIVLLLILIAQNKGFDALNATQKKPSFLQSTISEKTKMNWTKTGIFYHFYKFLPYWPDFLIFFTNSTLQRAEFFFAFHSVHQDPSLNYQNPQSNNFFSNFSP